MEKKEAMIPVTFAAVALIFLAGSALFVASAAGTRRYGTILFPALCAALLLLCSVLELRKILKMPRDATNANDALTPRLPFLFGLGIVVPALLFTVGFIPTGLTGIFILCLLIRIPWTKGLPLAIVLTVAIYALFDVALRVQLPRGFFF